MSCVRTPAHTHQDGYCPKKETEIARVGKGVEKSELIRTVAGNVKWGGHCGKQ